LYAILWDYGSDKQAMCKWQINLKITFLWTDAYCPQEALTLFPFTFRHLFLMEDNNNKCSGWERKWLLSRDIDTLHHLHHYLISRKRWDNTNWSTRQCILLFRSWLTMWSVIDNSFTYFFLRPSLPGTLSGDTGRNKASGTIHSNPSAGKWYHSGNDREVDDENKPRACISAVFSRYEFSLGIQIKMK